MQATGPDESVSTSGTHLVTGAETSAPPLQGRAGANAEAGRGLWESIRSTLRLSREGPLWRSEKPAEETPLSPAQDSQWFLHQLAADSPVYNYHAALHLCGDLDVEALSASLNETVRRHDTLRTTVDLREGRPVQRVCPSLSLEVPLRDVPGDDPEEQGRQVQRLLLEGARQPFDLTSGPLLRGQLLRLGKREHILLLVAHHIIFDDRSLEILWDELSSFYARLTQGKTPGPVPEVLGQYADYAAWQREWLTRDEVRRQVDFWTRQLQGAALALALPTDRPRPAVRAFRGERLLFCLSDTLTERLRALGRREEATLFAVLLAALGTLLYRYTGQETIVIGTPISTRTRKEMEHLIGLFLNTLALRIDLAGELSFRALLRQVQRMALEAYAHRDIPFHVLAQELDGGCSPSRNPLFQVMFIYANKPQTVPRLPGVEVTRLPLDAKVISTDLTFLLREEGPRLCGAIGYDEALFEAETVRRMVHHWQVLLRGIAANPDERLANLPLLTDGERHQLLVTWNDTATRFPQDLCVPSLVEEQVQRTPQAIALVWPTGCFTYEQLNTRANRIANALRTRGIGPNVPVALYLNAGPDLVAGILAILKAGGVYVPLDPTHPAERLGVMITEAKPRVLLTSAALMPSLPPQASALLSLEEVDASPGAAPPGQPASPVAPEHLAYIIFTSGSTGRPKGAAVFHRGFTNLLHWFTRDFFITSQDKFLLISSASFDLSQKDILGPLLVGASLVLPRATCFDPDYLLSLLEQHQITILNCTPSAFYPLVEAAEKRAFVALTSLRYLFLGGEPIALPRLRAWMTAPAFSTRIVNTYGPTECTDVCTSYTLDAAACGPGAVVPIGRPIANTKIFLLDSQNHPVPTGVPGEVCIGGVAVGAGYINQPELTRQKFITSPFPEAGSDRLYRTGDLGRYLPDGNIQLLGRADDQVKLRGFRLQLGEIEAVLGEHPGIREAAVLLREDNSRGPQLVAYIVPAGTDVPPGEEVRTFLKRRLPSYMIPAVFVPLSALPLTSRGKVDRHALPAPGGAALGDTYVAPAPGVGEILAQIWRQVLGAERVGANDDFFDLGGHSLLAITLRSRMEAVFGISIPLLAVFEHSTLGDQSTFLENRLLSEMGETQWLENLQELGGVPEAEVERLLDQERALIARSGPEGVQR